jgi:hypothetical protein
MITEPTVLIVGAGASKPFGFPIGTELKERICSELLDTKTDVHIIINEFNGSQLQSFVKDLKYSGFYSVDAFLEVRQEYEKIGKRAIAAILLEEEARNENQLFASNTWFQYLFNILTNNSKNLDSFQSNKISIITYNYDRAIEHYLFTALKSSFGKPDQEIKTVMENLNIIHLHGSLGKLPWQGGKYPFNYTHFDGSVSSLAIRQAKSSQQSIERKRTILCRAMEVATDAIKIIHEVELKNDMQFQNAIQALKKAQTVYFLGFGFSETNLKRLDYRNWNNLRKCAGTIYGIDAQTQTLLRDTLFGEKEVRFEGHDKTCYDFLRSVVVFK